MKILTVVGARPQFIKAAVLSREFSLQDGFEEVILHTGQHYDASMSDQFFTELEIPKPQYNLGVKSDLPGQMTGKMLEGVEEVLLKEKPDALLVYGDTNSTLAGALAASKLGVKLIHVEAGLRSFNMAMPEEVNRILTDRISNLLCCPTELAVRNLKAEGFDHMKLHVVQTGDVMQDAAMYYSKRSQESSTIIQKLKLEKFILCTIHRQENTNDPVRMKNIIDAINQLNTEIPVVLPLHPRTRKIFASLGVEPKCTIIDPVGYFDMIELIRHSSLVMTDSGGLQKEAYFFSKLCVTLRDETEWVELIDHNFNVLAGAETHSIVSKVKNFLQKKFESHIDLYGGGKAGKNILSAIQKYIR